MWKNLLHPSIKRSSWTAREDEVLKRLAAAGEERYWDVVADELNKYLIDDPYKGLSIRSQFSSQFS